MLHLQVFLTDPSTPRLFPKQKQGNSEIRNENPISILDSLMHRRFMRQWGRAARLAGTSKLSRLRHVRTTARLLRSHLDRWIHKADEQLALPIIGSNNFSRPHNAYWAWRPKLWRGPLQPPGMSSVQTKSILGNEATLFHDCQLSELTLRQLRNQREEALAPYGVRMDVFKLDGSFLSLGIDRRA